MPTLTTYDGRTIRPGESATLDANYPVTVQRVIAPADDDDSGSVQITYEWGATESVSPLRLAAYISD